MKGLAPPDTLTGKLQRALNDEWRTQAQLVLEVEPGFKHSSATFRACLERLVKENRAESRQVPNSGYMSGGYYQFRRKQ